MTHPEIAAEQAHIDRAHMLLDQARERARQLRGMVEVGRGGTGEPRCQRRQPGGDREGGRHRAAGGVGSRRHGRAEGVGRVGAEEPRCQHRQQGGDLKRRARGCDRLVSP